MSIDKKRMAEAMSLCDNLVDIRHSAGHVADEYDRLTREWQERLRSVNIAPSSTPTRSQK